MRSNVPLAGSNEIDFESKTLNKFYFSLRGGKKGFTPFLPFSHILHFAVFANIFFAPPRDIKRFNFEGKTNDANEQ